LSRNESTTVSTKTILDDIIETGEKSIQSRNTLEDYTDFLKRLRLIENQPAYSENYRSKERLGKSPKRHLTDNARRQYALYQEQIEEFENANAEEHTEVITKSLIKRNGTKNRRPGKGHRH